MEYNVPAKRLIPTLTPPGVGSGVHTSSSAYASSVAARGSRGGLGVTRVITARDGVSGMRECIITFFAPPGEDIRQVTHAVIAARGRLSVIPARRTPDGRSGMPECSILFGKARGRVFGRLRTDLSPPWKFVLYARVKDAQDSVSGMHECSILLSTARGNSSGTHTRRPPGAGCPV